MVYFELMKVFLLIRVLVLNSFGVYFLSGFV